MVVTGVVGPSRLATPHDSSLHVMGVVTPSRAAEALCLKGQKFRASFVVYWAETTQKESSSVGSNGNWNRKQKPRVNDPTSHVSYDIYQYVQHFWRFSLVFFVGQIDTINLNLLSNVSCTFLSIFYLLSLFADEKDLINF